MTTEETTVQETETQTEGNEAAGVTEEGASGSTAESGQDVESASGEADASGTVAEDSETDGQTD